MTPAAKEMLDGLKLGAKELGKAHARACDNFRAALETRVKPHKEMRLALKDFEAQPEVPAHLDAYVRTRTSLTSFETEMASLDQAKGEAGASWSAVRTKITAVEDLQKALAKFRAEFPGLAPLDFEL